MVFVNKPHVFKLIFFNFVLKVLFWLPPESPAKMVLGMNIFTSFFVLLLLLSKNVPSATDRIPLIGGYYCLNMIMIATSTCACTVVVHIFFRGTGRIPYVIRKIFLEFLAKLFCMVPPATLPPTQSSIPRKTDLSVLQHQQSLTLQQHQPLIVPVTMTTSCLEDNHIQSNGNLTHQIGRHGNSSPFKRSLNEKSMSHLTNESKQLTKSCAQLSSDQPENMLQQHYTLPRHNHSQNAQQQQQQQHQQQQINYELSSTLNLIENDIKEIRDYLRHTRKKLETTDAKAKQTNEWKQVALVLDRALFFCYCIAIVVSLALMFPR